MSEIDTFDVGDPLPRIKTASIHSGFKITVTWGEGLRAGKTDMVDLAPDIFTLKVYAPLRDNPDLFATLRVENWGTALAWGSGEIDMPADSIEELANQAMTPTDFSDWLKHHGFTYDAAAAQLGISRRQVAYYASTKEVPRTVALACAWLDAKKSEPGQAQAVPSSPLDPARWGAPMGLGGLAPGMVLAGAGLVPTLYPWLGPHPGVSVSPGSKVTFSGRYVSTPIADAESTIQRVIMALRRDAIAEAQSTGSGV